MVRWHTRAACQWLATRNVNATIRVPWLGTSSEKVGVDDYLAQGYALDGMAHQDAKYTPRPLAHYNLTKSQTSVLSWLLERHGLYGAFLPGRVAHDLGISRKTVYLAYRRFEELGIMRVWKGKRESTQDGVVQTPHVYHFTEPVDVDYKTWLETLPVPSPRL